MGTSIVFLGCNVNHQKVSKQIYAIVYSTLFTLGDSKNVEALFQGGLWEGARRARSSDPPLSRWEITDCMELGGGELTCELPVAPTALSKRKVTPLPVEDLIPLYMSAQMASCSLGLIFKNWGK